MSKTRQTLNIFTRNQVGNSSGSKIMKAILVFLIFLHNLHQVVSNIAAGFESAAFTHAVNTYTDIQSPEILEHSIEHIMQFLASHMFIWKVPISF